MHFNSRTLCAFIFTLCVLQLQSAWAANLTFCSTICADSTSACFGAASTECWACAQNIYYLQKNSSGDCQTKPQNQIAFFELKNDAMDLTGYSSSKTGPQICDQYSLSGQYVAGDFIQKTFTGLPLNHYQVVVRFGVGYIGSWNSADQMQLQVDGQLYSWKYNFCAYSEALCSSSGADCFKIYEQVISHDTASLSLRFSSSIANTDPTVQYWGVKDLLIVLRTCHSKCETCFGPGAADCSSCAPGYLLLGNLCVSSCSYFALPSKRVCLEECPSGFFGDSATKKCETCQSHCLVCSDSQSCSVWSPDKDGLIWEQNKFFWILLIVIGFLIFLYLLWRLVLRKLFQSKVEDSSQLKKSIMSQNNIEDRSKIQEETLDRSNNNRAHSIQNSIKERENSTMNLANMDTINFQIEQPEIPWTFQLPENEGGGNVYLSQHHISAPKRRKKKQKNIEAVDISIPSTIHLQGTNENLKL